MDLNLPVCCISIIPFMKTTACRDVDSFKIFRMTSTKLLLTLWLSFSGCFLCAHAQQAVHINKQYYSPKIDTLNAQQRAIIHIAAFSATGNIEKLHPALSSGLNVGLPLNDIKEILVQLYAYAGFPRSLNALNTFMAVVKDREQKGIHDVLGKEPTPLPTGKNNLQFGTDIQTKLVGHPIKGDVYEFAPAIDVFLKEHLFGDIFGRDNLDWQTRELATIAALAALGSVGNQLRGHFAVGVYNGLTEAQMGQLASIIKTDVGTKEGVVAEKILRSIVEETQGTSADTSTNDIGMSDTSTLIFPTGTKITNSNFSGTVYLNSLVENDNLNDTRVGNVTFAPGARSHWHSHPGGQILMVTNGTGFYQEKGSPKTILRKGDVIKCPPNVAHWHGAINNDIFIQLSITRSDKGPTLWLQPVSDDEYNSEK